MMFDQLRRDVATVTDYVRSYWTGPLSSRDPALADAIGLGPTSTGVAVTSETAFNSSAFWSAVSIIAGDVASLPLELFKRDQDGSTKPFVDSKLYEIVHDTPNPEMTSFTLREASQGHVLTWGNAYAEIERNGAGRPAALWPITPDRVVPFRQDRRVKYRVRNAQQGDTVLEAADMLHVPGLGFDGLMGYSVIDKARDSISMGLAIQRFGGSFFGNGATFGGVLSHPQNLTKEVKQGIRESIDAVHGGVDRAHKFVILGGGMSYTKLGIPPNDAQFLESRRFEIEEIARWFHMPQHKLNGLDHATFSNIVQLNLEYYTSCVRGWLVRWEQELNRKLVSPLERKQQYFKHNPEAILRADPAGRADFYAKQFGIGAISINEIRELENRNSIGSDGDVYFVPANMMPVERLINPPKPPAPALPTVTDVTPQTKELPPKRDEEQDADLRALVTTIAEKTEAIQTAIVQEQDATTQAERDQHVAEIARLNAEAAELQRRLDETLARASADVLAAKQETDAERAAREAAETQAAIAAADRAVESAERAKAVAREEAATEARMAAEAAAAEALAKAETERAGAIEDRTAWRVAVDETAAAQRELERLRDELTPAREAQTAAEAQLAEARALLVQREAANADAAARLLAQREAETARLTGMLAAHRALIVDAMGRMVRRETEKARRHQATPEKLRAWVEVFYLTHEDTCVDALRPAIRAHLAWKSVAEDVDTVTLAFVKDHIAESVRQLRAVIDGTEPDDLSVTLERLMQKWEQHRADALADRVLKDEIEFVRSYR